MPLLTKMSKSAMVPEQVCLHQPFELWVSYRSLWWWVARAWSSRWETPITEGVVWPSNSTHHCRAESVYAVVSDELTVVCEIRRCIVR